MIKMLSLLKRKPGLGRDDFQDHYESVRVPLMLSLLSGPCRDVRYHVRSCDHAASFGEFPFDVLTDCGYENREAADAALAVLTGGKERGSLPNEASDEMVMDQSASRFFAVSERVLQGQVSDEGDVSTFILVARSPGMTRYDASARMVREYWPPLRELCDVSSFVLLRDAFPAAKGVLSFDQVIQVASPIPKNLEKWVGSLKACGYQISVAETQRLGAALTEPSARDRNAGGARAAK